MNQTDIILTKLDRMFAPDLKVRIDDEGKITGFAPVSQLGARFLLRSASELLGADYDRVRELGAGLTFEVHE